MSGDPDMSVGSPEDRAHEMIGLLRISDDPFPNAVADRMQRLEAAVRGLIAGYLDTCKDRENCPTCRQILAEARAVLGGENAPQSE